jgi:branched-subunit amino acid transport protein
MDEDARLALIVALMAAVTYLPRVLPLMMDVSRWPTAWRRAIDFLPVAVVAAVVMPPLLATIHTPQQAGLIAAAPTLLCARLTRSLAATVIVGTVTAIVAGRFLMAGA